MSWSALRRSVIAAAALALVVSLGITASGAAQGLYYREIEKDGRIYVFSTGKRAEAFEKSGEIGTAITRVGAGPSGETLVFENEEAINLYNFKHGLAGEYFPKPAEPAKSPYPAGKFSGLMFGDYYHYDKWHQNQISDSNKNNVQGQQGLWFRRIYFTYDLQLSEKFTTRFRLEANSNGQLTSPGNINPYIKDAYLKWTFTGKQALTLGIQPSLTFDWYEGFWGLRHIEKTPADLYRIDSSRDLGLAVGGPITAVDHLSYAAQFGNESGTGSETDKYKILRLEGRYDMNPGFAVEGFYSFGARPSGQDRTTAQAILGWRNPAVRVAGQYLYQKRDSGKADTPDQKIEIWSVFGYWEFAPKKADVFARFDNVKGKQDSTTTGLPGADGIDYWILSPKQSFKMYIFGGEYYLHPSIRISPNVEWAKYDSDPDPANFPGRDTDRIYRLTFFWTF